MHGILYVDQERNDFTFFVTHIDKFFHNSPGTEMCLGTPHFRDLMPNFKRAALQKSMSDIVPPSFIALLIFD